MPPPSPRALRLNLRAAPAVPGALSLLQGPGTVKAPTLSLAPVCQPGRLLGTTGAPDPCTQQGHLHRSHWHPASGLCVAGGNEVPLSSVRTKGPGSGIPGQLAARSTPRHLIYTELAWGPPPSRRAGKRGNKSIRQRRGAGDTFE